MVTSCAALFAQLMFLAASLTLHADSVPNAADVSPRIGNPGATLTVTGTGLDRSALDEIYLTDHTFDLKVKILEQSPTSLKLRIPPFAKPGRFQLLFLTASKKPVLLEQPFQIEIEEAPAAMQPSDAPAGVSALTSSTSSTAWIGWLQLDSKKTAPPAAAEKPRPVKP